ncbi:MAG: ABC-type sugar transport system, ATPase component [Mesotoga infera]|uniref:ABC-type sugar transport system, ATPase component n=1 Tax=Mesotoga infera TaxID=1236046 RepID=A0A101I7J7_9BACT|nr:MAG: ABC-type sugar transport system, ATPase component [Mesotoga infera]
MGKNNNQNNKNLIIDLQHISKRYGGVQALIDVDFSLKEGEIHCLVGENGSGKSTLIKIISGVEQPEKEACIYIKGEKQTILSPIISIQKGIQVIYQDLSLFSNLTVAENITINNYSSGNLKLVNWKKIKDLAQKTLKKLGIQINPNQVVNSLSIADRQLVAICRAIATNARLIIMDEPTSSLARHEINSLFSIIKELQKEGITILFVSHKLDEILEISERVTVLRDGTKVGVFQRNEINDQKLSFLMTGKEFANKKVTKTTIDEHILLQVKNLSKKGNYKNISFELHRGEILGIIGMIGSGRTELAFSLFGINPPDQGEILIEGKPIQLNSNKDAIQSGIAYVPEDRIEQGLIMDQSIKNNITVTIFHQLLNHFNMVNREKQENIAKHWIDKLSIRTPNTKNPVKTLSGGNQQKTVLAKWLSTNPKILILDSPTVGIDVAAKHAIYTIMKELSLKNIGIILISDEVQEVLYNCQRILLMRKGQFVQEFKPFEISEKKLNQKIVEV